MYEKMVAAFLALLVGGTLVYLLVARVYPSITNKK
jgi:hypothetical protein